MVGISKATYYNARDPKLAFEEKYAHLKQKVEKIIEDNPKYGVKRIKAALREKHRVVIGKETLRKLLITWKLNVKRKVAKHRPSAVQKILTFLGESANLVQALANAGRRVTEPFKVITSDITQIRYAGGKGTAYLCVHKDLIGQVVYGYDFRLDMTKQLAINSLRQANQRLKRLLGISTKELKRRRIVYHQDRGSQNTSYQYIDEVLAVGRLSYSRPGTPTDNPGQESFFGRFKEDNEDEFLECETFEQLQELVRKKLRYYNRERIHTSIGYQSPMAYTKSFLKSVVSGLVK